jgi:hypothetical protein
MSEVSGVIANLLGTGKPGHLQPELHMLGIAFLQKGLKDVLLKWQEVAPIWMPALHYHERPAAWACCVARSLLLTYVHLTHLFIYLLIKNRIFFIIFISKKWKSFDPVLLLQMFRPMLLLWTLAWTRWVQLSSGAASSPGCQYSCLPHSSSTTPPCQRLLATSTLLLQHSRGRQRQHLRRTWPHPAVDEHPILGPHCSRQQ